MKIQLAVFTNQSIEEQEFDILDNLSNLLQDAGIREEIEEAIEKIINCYMKQKDLDIWLEYLSP